MSLRVVCITSSSVAVHDVSPPRLLEKLQALVGGELELIAPNDSGIGGYVNGNAIHLGYPRNPMAREWGPIRGPVVLLRFVDDPATGEIIEASLTNDDIGAILSAIKN